MPGPLGLLFICEQVSVLIRVEKERSDVGGLSALGIGCQLVHQLANDTSLIHHLLFGVGQKQGAGKGESDIVGFFWAQNGH